MSTERIAVLHVDDEPKFADLTATWLEKEDGQLSVHTETSATEGLDHLETESIDCIVSDYQMPGMDGLDFLEAVRENHPELPFILFTGEGSEAVAADAIKAGVTSYHQKETGTAQYTLLANRIRTHVERHRTERRAAALEQEYELVAETATDAFWTVDVPTDTVTYSDGIRSFGYEPSEIPGDTDWFFERVHPDDRERLRQFDDALFARERDAFVELSAERGEFSSEFRFQRADGSYAHCRDHGVILFENGDPVKLVGTMTDVSERMERERELERRERALRRVYEVIGDGTRSVDEQIDELLEIGRDVIGTSYATFSRIDGSQYEFEAVAVAPGIDLEAGTTTSLVELPICERVFRTGQPLVLDDVEVDAPELVDPTWGISCYLGAPVDLDGEVYGTFCFYDTEERSGAFSDWEQTLVEILGDWVSAALTRQRDREELERQNERLDEFAGIVSHDLRAPLSAAQGWLELARDDCDSDLLADVARGHSRMESLIDDLLTFAQNGGSVTEQTPVDLADTAEGCWRNIETADATLVTETEETVRADGSRFQQLLENLLGNAIEHGGGDVTVTIGSLPGESGFYVEDDGPGIPEDEREEVFERGYSTATDGTGFGLAIVKQIVEAHGWEVNLTESDAGGARFEVTGVESVQ